MLHKMRRGKNPSCRRCGAEKETWKHILCECLELEKISMQILDFVRMDSDQIKEARVSSIVAFGKGYRLIEEQYTALAIKPVFKSGSKKMLR